MKEEANHHLHRNAIYNYLPELRGTKGECLTADSDNGIVNILQIIEDGGFSASWISQVALFLMERNGTHNRAEDVIALPIDPP
jgi:hypothetical protein